MIPTLGTEKEILQSIIRNFNTTPFLFIGSGLTRRYCNLPNWENLLKHFIDILYPNRPFAFTKYKQETNFNYPKLGTLIGKHFDQCWFDDPSIYPLNDHYKELIQQGISPFKCAISEFIESNTHTSDDYIDEIELFTNIIKHNISGIITTNYDSFLENLTQDFKVYVGQKDLLFSPIHELGEIFKIHGSITQPSSIVINENDYLKFNEKSKYLAAKLLTIFIEYPIIFMGYSLSDSNVKTIINDIANCLDEKAITSLSNRFIMITRAKEDEPPIDISINHYEVNKVHIPMINIKLKDFSILYHELAKLKPSVPVKLLRLYRESFYNHTLTTTKVRNILVNLDSETINPEDLVFTLSRPGDKSLLGLKGITAQDWYRNILLDNLPFTSDDMLSIAYPVLAKSGNKLPVFKYLNTAIKRYPSINKQYEIENINQLLNNQMVKTKLNRNYQNKTIKMLQSNLTLKSLIYETAYLPEDNIDTSDLKELLIRALTELPIFSNDTSLDTAFRRLVRIYDWLSFSK